MEYYSAIKKDCLDICANADGPYVNYAKWNKSDGERQIPCDSTFKWNLKQKQTKKQTKDLIDTENGLVVARDRVWGFREIGEDGQKVKRKKKLKTETIMIRSVKIPSNQISCTWYHQIHVKELHFILYTFLQVWLAAFMLLFSCPVLSDSLWLHGPQHARPPCPSPSPEICTSSCPLHWWYHPAISSSDALFSFCLCLSQN